MTTTSKFSAKRSKPNYFFSILGVALVLFILGILGWIVINANKLEEYLRGNVEIQAFIRENTPQREVDSLKAYIAAQPYTRQVEYISKDEARQRFIKDGNDDWSRVLDYNPLPASLDFRVKNEYVNQDSLSVITRDIQQHLIVQEVKYPVAVVDNLNRNVRQAEMILLAIVILLAVITIVLIDTTIKLAMFSNRFLIKTMQMVGATRVFIARPFDLKAVVNGLISALIAIAAVATLIFWAERALPDLKALRDNMLLGILFGGLLFIGVSITFLSTHRSVVKYLKMKLDDLY
ncbi:MAG TPA: permease-like cell division protein FtsX [Dinghuibacter sp.]|jgi:cell division transport system permease protein|uniref:cell division protein FtsX n=1 Tax=Dinghuibacter sp. TaxID=2024697 RepID=UPI002BADF95C|nr:permease-like cell division protein FtsX [Dinghuibacter sp.]HTJ13513.1 permease-like cell division protein FtsX [Dinghuibacter sp.]